MFRYGVYLVLLPILLAECRALGFRIQGLGLKVLGFRT